MGEKFDLKQEVKALEDNTKLGNNVSDQLNKLQREGHLNEVKTQILADKTDVIWTEDHIVFQGSAAGPKIYDLKHGFLNSDTVGKWEPNPLAETKIAIDQLMNSGKSIQEIMKANGYASMPDALGKINSGKPGETVADADKHK